MTRGYMPNTVEGDAINTDDALLIKVGQANVLNQCGDGLPRQTELGYLRDAGSIASCILSRKHFH